jgi:hypothetical protein
MKVLGEREGEGRVRKMKKSLMPMLAAEGIHKMVHIGGKFNYFPLLNGCCVSK